MASLLMSRDLWLPFWIGIGLLLTAILSLKLFPRTPESTKRTTGASTTREEDQEEETPLLNPITREPSHSPRLKVKSLMRVILDEVRHTIDLISGRGNFQLLCAVFFGAALASSSTNLLPIYISRRYLITYEWVSSAGNVSRRIG